MLDIPKTEILIFYITTCGARSALSSAASDCLFLLAFLVSPCDSPHSFSIPWPNPIFCAMLAPQEKVAQIEVLLEASLGLVTFTFISQHRSVPSWLVSLNIFYNTPFDWQFSAFPFMSCHFCFVSCCNSIRMLLALAGLLK